MEAENWFLRFGFDRTVISATGARMFRIILAEMKRLQKQEKQ